MILQIYNRLRRISMKIQFGITLTPDHVFGSFLLGWVVFGIVWLNFYLQSLFEESQESILRSRGLNVTNKSPLFFCVVPYDDCLCSVLSNISNTSEKCITNVELVGNRILPLISFLLQIFLVRELFSLSTDHRRVIIYALWTASTVVFIGMTTSIYLSSCYHAYITVILYLTGASLCLLSSHNLLIYRDYMTSVSNQNIIVIVHKSERTNSADKSWQELL